MYGPSLAFQTGQGKCRSQSRVEVVIVERLFREAASPNRIYSADSIGRLFVDRCKI